MKVRTGNGDDGRTTLPGAKGRMSKAEDVFEVLGWLDMSIADIGVARHFADRNTAHSLMHAQFLLDDMKRIVVGEEDVVEEGSLQLVLEMADQPVPVKDFTVPGHNGTASVFIHRARASVRTAERMLVRHVDAELLKSSRAGMAINAISDALFVLAEKD